MKGQVKNYSSKKLWVLVSKGNQMYAYQLTSGCQSPSNIDADGFCAVDETPIDDYKGWVKIVDICTAEVIDKAGQLTSKCMFCGNVEDKEFGKVKFIYKDNWGEPIV
ncbi:MAG: hypothetical protein QNJ72_39005 [Pleurocapsa sp. MO_226.B13]|nr:hypothetical protein [Pleurocapsa sp. MO_226.B13]